MKRVYMDYAASTPCAPEVVEAMVSCLRERFGNASSRIHWAGREAAEALWEARAKLAKILGARSASSLIFTSGATEANNLAIKGFVLGSGRPGRIVTTSVEHPSVLEPCRFARRLGWEIVEVGVNTDGVLRLEELKAALRYSGPLLVSIQAANGETGVIQPMAEVCRIAKEHGAVLHSDAAQLLGKVETPLWVPACDMLTGSAHKFYGPKGVGFLLVSSRIRLSLVPLLHGGGQEGGLRAGTPNVPGAVGCAVALELAVSSLPSEADRLGRLRGRLEEGLLSRIEGLKVVGRGAPRLPSISNVVLPRLDAYGLLSSIEWLAASPRSACSSEREAASHVLVAMGFSKKEASRAVRFSLGRWSTDEEVELVVDAVAALFN